MEVKKTQASLLPSLLLMLLCLSFHVRVREARPHHVVRISTPSSGSTPPSPACGTGIHHVAGASDQRPCRRPRRPSAADP